MTAEIIPFKPPLTDIPAMLRGVADAIEAGEYGDVDHGVLILPVDDDYPILFCWGPDGGDLNRINFLLDLAKHSLMANIMERS